MSENGATPQPMLYQRPAPLQAERHGALSLREPGDYRFAAASNAVPLVASEFFLAQRDFPIVFTDEPLPLPVAVLGLAGGSNLFVESDGRWRAPAYPPAYLRRYPFIFAEAPESGALTLCVDEASTLLEPGGPRPLFENGQPSALLREILEFCASYQRDHAATRALSEALRDAGLLVKRDAQVRLSAEHVATLRGFHMVDEAKLNALPDATLGDWHRRGWLGCVYAHLMSQGCWDRLAAIAGRG